MSQPHKYMQLYSRADPSLLPRVHNPPRRAVLLSADRHLLAGSVAVAGGVCTALWRHHRRSRRRHDTRGLLPILTGSDGVRREDTRAHGDPVGDLRTAADG